MGRACTVCTNAVRAAIGAALETDRPLRGIAAEFGVSKTALHRHWQAHIAGQPAPQEANSGTGRAIARKTRPAILKWAIAGGIGILVGWRILAAPKRTVISGQ